MNSSISDAGGSEPCTDGVYGRYRDTWTSLVATRINVVLVAPSLSILGGQAVQADRLLRAWDGDPEVAASLLPVNPDAPGPLGALQRIKYVRTGVTQLWYWPSLLTRLRQVAGIVRPDLYGNHATPTAAPVERTAGDLTEQAGPQLGGGLNSNPTQEAFNTPGPYIPSQQLRDNLEPPKVREVVDVMIDVDR